MVPSTAADKTKHPESNNNNIDDKNSNKNKSNSNSNSNNDIVRLNVGGTIYDVSRSLLNTYPNTVLAARLTPEDPLLSTDGDWCCCDTGRTAEEDGTTAAATAGPSSSSLLFLEGNGDRFQYCLDYMRNGGTVHLPATTSKKAVLLELGRYGFEDVDESKIHGAADQNEEQKQQQQQQQEEAFLRDRLLRAHVAEISIRTLGIQDNLLLTKNRIFHSTLLALLGVGSLTLGTLTLMVVGVEAVDILKRRFKP